MARIAKSAKSSPNKRAFEAIMKCSVQIYLTTMKGDDIYWEAAKGGYQNSTTLSQVYVSEASYPS